MRVDVDRGVGENVWVQDCWCVQASKCGFRRVDVDMIIDMGHDVDTRVCLCLCVWIHALVHAMAVCTNAA